MAMKRSGRRSARRGGRASARGGRASQRGAAGSSRSTPDPDDDEDRLARAAARKKSSTGGGTEMMILCGVLVALVVAVLVFWKIRTDEVAAFKHAQKMKRRARESNINVAYSAFQSANRVGKEFVIGNAPDAKKEDLVGPLRSNAKIYNVIFDRQYKAKGNKQETQQFAMDTNRMRVTRYGKSEFKNGITMTYAKAENETLPVFLAEKTFKPEEGDKKNLGGRITVIVRAEEEKKP